MYDVLCSFSVSNPLILGVENLSFIRFVVYAEAGGVVHCFRLTSARSTIFVVFCISECCIFWDISVNHAPDPKRNLPQRKVGNGLPPAPPASLLDGPVTRNLPLFLCDKILF